MDVEPCEEVDCEAGCGHIQIVGANSWMRCDALFGCAVNVEAGRST